MLSPVERYADLAAKYRRLQASYQRSLFSAREVRHRYTRLQRASLLGLEGLADALESRDRYTRGHSGRVGAWARQTAFALGWSADHADLVGQAGRLHDIGKIGVPEVLLRKTEALSADEGQARRRHPEIGARIVAPFDFFEEGAEIIRHHHERWDGSGYPDGLTGSRIPVGARIVAVADVFDALTSDRPDRVALSVEAAVGELRREAGRTLDPRLVEVFVAARASA
jgi:HD-GYP domain-containing protein (c-di-GMP phosphodiesterase class II)